MGAVGGEQDAGEGTDFHAINNGYVSITPLEIDLTRYKVMDDLQYWVENLD